MEDKSSLLNQLKIEREPVGGPSGMSAWVAGTLVVIALLLGAGGSYYYFGSETSALEEELAAAKVAAAEAERAASRLDFIPPRKREFFAVYFRDSNRPGIKDNDTAKATGKWKY